MQLSCCCVPKRSFMKHLRPFLIGCSLCATASFAQLPTSVDIDLRRGEMDTTRLEVYIRANDLAYYNTVSTIQFTIRWETTSAASLGQPTNACPIGMPVGLMESVDNPLLDGVPTGYNYRGYLAIGVVNLSDVGCALPP